MNHTNQSVRPSPIAGKWYSNNEVLLKEEIISYLEAGKLEIVGEVKGVIAPHAGYRYSGKTAGVAFQSVFGAFFDLVVILAPFHAYHDAPLLSTGHTAYSTPLGSIDVDLQTLKDIANDYEKSFGTALVQLINDQEHSLEIELPFLQCSLKPGFKILPMMIRTIDPEFSKKIAEILLPRIKNKQVLVVASTDLSHFYPEKDAKQYDYTMLKAFEAFSSEEIYLTEQLHRGFACGAGAVMTVVELTKRMGANKVQILQHTTSADETGDTSSVVGYGAAVITKTPKQGV